MKKITHIPDEVRAQFPAIVRRAIEDGLRCEPADRPRAEAALRTIYRMAGLSDRVPIIWVSSPLVGALAASIAAMSIARTRNVHSAVNSAVHSAVHSAVNSAVHSAVNSAVNSAVHSAVNSAVYSDVHRAVHRAVYSDVDSDVYNAVHRAVHRAVYRAVYSDVDSDVDSDVHSDVDSAVDSDVYRAVRWHEWRGGQMWMAWPALVEATRALGVDHPSFAAIRAERDVCGSAGYYWPNRNFIMICERPQAINRDVGGRLHCETGPAVDYGVTFRFYSWHGTTIPAGWIENRAALSAQAALTWENVEQRRAACEIVGWSRILAELSATTINRHDNPQIGTLLEVDLPGSGRSRFLKVLCGTGREFVHSVPREVQTAFDAQAWMWSVDSKEFKQPEVRT